MNVERLHAIAAELQKDLDDTETVSTLKGLVSSLANQVAQPQQPQFQEQTSAQLKELLTSLENASVNKFSPTWRQVLDEIGATTVTGANLAETIRQIFSANQITPSVAQQELQALLNQVAQLSSALDQIIEGFEKLRIGAENLQPGECELGILVPRLFVESRLDRFAEELEEMNRVFGVFAEIASGSRPGLEIKTISSTDLSVYLHVSPIIGACIAHAMERLVGLYKQLLEIRKLQNDLAQQGVEKENLKGIEKHANTIMESGIDKLVKDLMNEHLVEIEKSRSNELSIELKYSLKKIANRIDRGFNIEVRMNKPDAVEKSPEEVTPDEKMLLNAHAVVAKASENMQFLKLEGEPILKLQESQNDKSKS